MLLKILQVHFNAKRDKNQTIIKKNANIAIKIISIQLLGNFAKNALNSQLQILTEQHALKLILFFQIMVLIILFFILDPIIIVNNQ
jgi:hypothetical protein